MNDESRIYIFLANKKKWWFIVVFICLFLVSLKFKLASLNSAWDSHAISVQPTFGYNNQRHGFTVLKGNLNFSGLERVQVQWAKDAVKVAPLVFEVESREYLVFGRRDETVLLVDLAKLDEVETLEINGVLASTPVFDVDRERIYFLSSQRDLARGVFRHFIHIFDFQSRNISSIPIDWGKLLSVEEIESLGPDVVTGMEANVHCVSSPLLDQDGNWVLFGCSMAPARGVYNYGSLGGVSGGLLVVHLEDKSDDLDADRQIEFIRLSQGDDIQSVPYDVGIWNSGSGPSQAPSGKVVISTGNGPYDPVRGSYGCSVVMMDIARDGSRFINHYSIDSQRFQECRVTNSDLGSSAAPVFGLGEHEFYAVLGKDNRLRIGRLSSTEQNMSPFYVSLRGSHTGYGQPLVLEDRQRDRVLIFAIQNSYVPEPVWSYRILPRGASSALAPDWERVGCIGYAKVNSPEGPRSYLAYSGPLRDNYILLREHSPAEKVNLIQRRNPLVDGTQYRHKGDFSSFVEVMPFDIEIVESEEKLPKTRGLEPRELVLGTYSYGRLATWARDILTPIELHEKETYSVGWILAQAGQVDKTHCEEEFEELIALDVYRRIFMPKNESHYRLLALEIQADQKVREIYRFTGNRDFTFSARSNISGAVGQDFAAIIGWPLFRGSVGQPGSTIFKIIDAHQGRVLDSVEIEGESHFSKPVFSSRYIFLATRNSSELAVFRYREGI